MNNLHRELAPISGAAWADLEEETRRTFTRHVAGRRIVDVLDPAGEELAAVGTGHLIELEPPAVGVRARARAAQPVIELRVPFSVSRRSVDDVERGAKDADWQPAKDAAKQLAFAEDRIIFDGWAPAGIAGIRPASDNAPIALPADVLAYPTALAQALSALRLAGVNRPYALALSAEAYTLVSETSDHGYPIHQHLARVVDEIIWAPAIEGAALVTTRGGDYALHLGQDVSIGYLAHDADQIELYLQETLTFMVQTTEAAVALNP